MFYQDEVDIDLNPKIGSDWCLKGQQKRIATPGINQKHYLAGALHAGTGQVHYASGSSKNSDLFIHLLVMLKRTYRRAKTITLIIDNYVIHKSHKVEEWLENNKKFRLIFLPTYSPWPEAAWVDLPSPPLVEITGIHAFAHLIILSDEHVLPIKLFYIPMTLLRD